MSFTHLHVHSNFSFLDGGSSVESLLDRARELGYDSLALTDHNGLYGAVRFYDYARRIGIKPIIGVELDLEPCFSVPNPHLVLLAKSLLGYSNLCRIITRAQLSHEKGEAAASLEVIQEHKDDLFCLSGCSRGEVPSLVAEGRLDEAREAAGKYVDIFGRDHFLIELQNHMLPGTALLNSRLSELANELGLRCVATNNVHYARKDDFKVQDVLVCVRTLTTLDERHPLRKRNAEYYMKSPAAMANLFRRYPRAVVTTDWVARQCNLDLGLGTYRFPDFPVPEGETAYSYLCKLCFEALDRLYRPITPQVTERLQHELKIIHDLGFSEYFLVVWDIVREARSRGIRCSGRGSAADSLVAYCLGITIVDPIEHNLLFERFLNPERKGMPDIDIDFDAARRDEIIEYIYNRYGEDKVAMVCTVSTLQARSSIRDLGKAMDFPQEDIDKFASALPHTGGKRIREAIEKLPELRNGNLPLHKLEALIDICEKVDNFPRHLSVHLGGLLIGKGPLTDLVPLEWAAKGVIVSQFDKDDIETLGLVKMDILGLRNLSAIEDAVRMIRENTAREFDIDNIPLDDEPTYELLRSGNTVGCFQVESPGMRGLLGRLQPRVFEDIIAQISLFRPGPMQADMINPFIARRHGEEPITYPHPSLEPVLKDTYGVILYQEQVLSVAHELAGFTYGQADSLRRAMTTDRSQEEMEKIRKTFIDSAERNGIDGKTAEEVFSRLRAFAAYGFCKAHAASFARITYQTAYLKAHYPAQFFAGILNNEPMGFYPANVIIEDARRLGIRILPVDINRSEKKFTVEGFGISSRGPGGEDRGARIREEVTDYRLQVADGSEGAPSPLAGEGWGEGGSLGIRIGLMQVKNISDAEIDSILAARSSTPFSSFSDFCLQTRCSRPTVENLINCGAFDSFGIPRAKLLWLLGELISRRSKINNHRSQVSDSNGSRSEHGEESAFGQGCLLDGLSVSDLEDQIRLLPDVPEPTLHERVRTDYEILGLSPICHPMCFYREKLAKTRVRTTSEIKNLPNNTIVKVAGVVVVCMRPPTKSGTIVVFITLEDEDGLVDCVVFPGVYDKFGAIIFNNPALIIEGRLQRMGKGISIIAQRVKPLTSDYRTDNSPQIKPFTERRRIAGQRSFVRSAGV
ncbi:MAG: DNA polymerase III subunit alpha [Armatimonadota bacterium]